MKFDKLNSLLKEITVGSIIKDMVGGDGYPFGKVVSITGDTITARWHKSLTDLNKDVNRLTHERYNELQMEKERVKLVK